MPVEGTHNRVFDPQVKQFDLVVVRRCVQQVVVGLMVIDHFDFVDVF